MHSVKSVNIQIFGMLNSRKYILVTDVSPLQHLGQITEYVTYELFQGGRNEQNIHSFGASSFSLEGLATSVLLFPSTLLGSIFLILS